MRLRLLRPGDRLPSARELANGLRVSNITTRRAYQELESEGLIVSQQGRGTFVAEDVVAQAAQRTTKVATTQLEEAVDQALRLGLSPESIAEVVQRHLRTREDT